MKPDIKSTTTEQHLIQQRRTQRKAMSTIEHRLEYVDDLGGIEYINDAKSSDLNSSWYSLECMVKPVVWILNTSSFEEDYDLFNEITTEKVKAIVIIGENPKMVMDHFTAKVNKIGIAEDLYDAVSLANEYAIEGDVVLYSPACSDFDNYKSYKESGQQFRKAVRQTRL